MLEALLTTAQKYNNISMGNHKMHSTKTEILSFTFTLLYPKTLLSVSNNSGTKIISLVSQTLFYGSTHKGNSFDIV